MNKSFSIFVVALPVRRVTRGFHGHDPPAIGQLKPPRFGWFISEQKNVEATPARAPQLEDEATWGFAQEQMEKLDAAGEKPRVCGERWPVAGRSRV